MPGVREKPRVRGIKGVPSNSFSADILPPESSLLPPVFYPHSMKGDRRGEV